MRIIDIATTEAHHGLDDAYLTVDKTLDLQFNAAEELSVDLAIGLLISPAHCPVEMPLFDLAWAGLHHERHFIVLHPRL